MQKNNKDAQNLSYKPYVSANSHKIFSKMIESGKVEVGQSYEDYLMKKGREYEANRQEL